MQIDIRARNFESGNRLPEFIDQRLRHALRPFADRIGRVEVYLRDVNGPRGGVDKRIRVVVRLRHSGHVVVDGTDANSFAAAADAVRRVRRSTRRALERRSVLRRRTAGVARTGTLTHAGI